MVLDSVLTESDKELFRDSHVIPSAVLGTRMIILLTNKGKFDYREMGTTSFMFACRKEDHGNQEESVNENVEDILDRLDSEVEGTESNHENSISKYWM